MAPVVCSAGAWALAVILITAQDRDVTDLVGTDRFSTVEDHLARNARDVEHRTEALIERARQRLAQYRAGTLPFRIQGKWQSASELFSGASCYATTECPACGGDGTVEGGQQVSFEYRYDLEDGSPVGAEARLEVPVGRFCCETHLVLEEYELMAQAGLPDTFEFIDNNPEWPDEEPDYGND